MRRNAPGFSRLGFLQLRSSGAAERQWVRWLSKTSLLFPFWDIRFDRVPKKLPQTSVQILLHVRAKWKQWRPAGFSARHCETRQPGKSLCQTSIKKIYGRKEQTSEQRSWRWVSQFICFLGIITLPCWRKHRTDASFVGPNFISTKNRNLTWDFYIYSYRKCQKQHSVWGL